MAAAVDAGCGLTVMRHPKIVCDGFFAPREHASRCCVGADAPVCGALTDERDHLVSTAVPREFMPSWIYLPKLTVSWRP